MHVWFWVLLSQCKRNLVSVKMPMRFDPIRLVYHTLIVGQQSYNPPRLKTTSNLLWSRTWSHTQSFTKKLYKTEPWHRDVYWKLSIHSIFQQLPSWKAIIKAFAQNVIIMCKVIWTTQNFFPKILEKLIISSWREGLLLENWYLEGFL